MQLEVPGFAPTAPITPAEAESVLSTGGWGDDPALKLVVQDAIRAENFENTKQWVMGWAIANALYQSPFTARYWEGTQVERANVPFYTVANAVNALVPQIVNGLFYDNPPFMTQNRPGTKALVAEAIGDLIAYQVEDINFREEIRLGSTNAVLFGTGLFKWGWEAFVKERKIYTRKNPDILLQTVGDKSVTITPDEEIIEEEIVQEYVDRPKFEHIVNLKHVLVDPGLQVPDIRKAKYVVHRMYMTWNELDALRERPGFDIPSREELLALFLPPKEQVEINQSEITTSNPMWDARSEPRYNETTADPFNQPLEILERWDKDKYIVVLQKKLVICNDDNPYGVIPFLSVGWWDIPEAFWSLGLGRTIGAEQRVQQGITNTWLDQAALNLNGVYVRVRGKSVPTQSIRLSPGKIVDVDNKDDFKPMDRLPAVPEALQHLQLSQSRAEQISGAGEASTQGIAGNSGHSNLARTAAGANLLSAGQGNRISDFVEKLSTQVIVPFLYHVHEMNRALLPVSTLKHILSEELENAWMKNKGDVVEILNGNVKFSITAGAKLSARKGMAQALPIMIQFLTNQQTENQLAVQKKKIDITQILRMLFEVSDWKNFADVVVDMTPEDEQRWQSMQPGAQIAAKTQAQAALADQKHKQDLDIVNEENIAKAGREVLRHTMEQSAQTFETTGQAGGEGFGANAQ